MLGENVCTYIRMYVRVCIYVCMYSMYVCMYVCLYVCMYVYVLRLVKYSNNRLCMYLRRIDLCRMLSICISSVPVNWTAYTPPIHRGSQSFTTQSNSGLVVRRRNVLISTSFSPSLVAAEGCTMMAKWP